MQIDGNASLTIGFVLTLIGSFLAVKGFQANRDSKKLAEGKEAGILEATLKTMKETLEAIRTSNETFQREHREEHQQIDQRIRVIEDDLLVIKTKPVRRKPESVT